MNPLLDYKISSDDIEVEYEIIPLIDESVPRKQTVAEGLNDVNARLAAGQSKIDELNKEIDRLTNHADGIDYMVAVGSGIVAGIVDSLWVGAFNFERGKAWGNDKVNGIVKKTAKSQGYKGDDLEGAIKHLEGKFGTPSDSVTSEFGGGLQHHLRDFAHHPTPVGLIFSMLTQFTGKAYGTNVHGVFMIVPVKDKNFIGKNIPEKILFGTVTWFFHLVSDMAGSSAYPGAGTGLPGPILSLLKEISALPIFKSFNQDGHKEFSVWLSKLFNGTLLAEHDENGKIIKDTVKRFDLRAELGVAEELSRQAIPVIINECIVRAFYFIRRLTIEIKEKQIGSLKHFNKINWKNTLPFKNRTIVRMLTIATGTFTLVDLTDAAIRGALKSGGNAALFAKEFVLRVNFVGVGRFAVAAATDIAMGVNRSKLRNKRIAIYSEQMHLMNAKVYYLQANMWIAAETTEKTINEAMNLMEKAAVFFAAVMQANAQSLDNIGKLVPQIEKHNPGLLEDINAVLNNGDNRQ